MKSIHVGFYKISKTNYTHSSSNTRIITLPVFWNKTWKNETLDILLLVKKFMQVKYKCKLCFRAPSFPSFMTFWCPWNTVLFDVNYYHWNYYAYTYTLQQRCSNRSWLSCCAEMNSVLYIEMSNSKPTKSSRILLLFVELKRIYLVLQHRYIKGKALSFLVINTYAF